LLSSSFRTCSFDDCGAASTISDIHLKLATGICHRFDLSDAYFFSGQSNQGIALTILVINNHASLKRFTHSFMTLGIFNEVSYRNHLPSIQL